MKSPRQAKYGACTYFVAVNYMFIAFLFHNRPVTDRKIYRLFGIANNRKDDEDEERKVVGGDEREEREQNTVAEIFFRLNRTRNGIF